MKAAHFARAKDVFFKEGMSPAYVILYVTSRCNLKCRHCFFHESLNKPEEISLKDIERLSKSLKNVLNASLTGGEPFLRKDLPEIAKLFVDNSNAAIVSITTNGMLPEVVEKATEKMLAKSPGTVFNLFVSIDGKKEMHNSIRGNAESYGNANKTLARLSKLKEKHKNLHIGITFTINELNAKDTIPIYKEMLKKYAINQFQINFMRGNPRSIKCSDKALDAYIEANKEIERDLAKGDYKGHKILGDFYTCINMRYKKVLANTVREKRFQVPCYAGTTNVVIYSNADVYACELRDDLRLGNLADYGFDLRLGNLADYGFDLRKLLSTPENKKLLREIRKSKCFCTFECQLSSNVAFNPKELMKASGLWLKLKAGMR